MPRQRFSDLTKEQQKIIINLSKNSGRGAQADPCMNEIRALLSCLGSNSFDHDECRTEYRTLDRCAHDNQVVNAKKLAKQYRAEIRSRIIRTVARGAKMVPK